MDYFLRPSVESSALRKSQRFTSRVVETSYVGCEAVFDITQDDGKTVILADWS
jgi:hypothetical protein